MAGKSIQERMGRIAQGFSEALSGSSGSDSCPHCGQSMPKDDVPELNKKDAQDFSDGMSQRPDYVKNLKSGLGIK